MKALTALEKIADNMIVANRHRDEYQQGKAAAYHTSHKIMKDELKRLRNLWQNNMLTYDSFNVGD